MAVMIAPVRLPHVPFYSRNIRRGDICRAACAARVVGSCVPDAVGPVVIATELGDPLDTVQLLQLSWERRLKSCAIVFGRRSYLKSHTMYIFNKEHMNSESRHENGGKGKSIIQGCKSHLYANSVQLAQVRIAAEVTLHASTPTLTSAWGWGHPTTFCFLSYPSPSVTLVHGVARLLYHLAHSPLGSLAMNDLRRQQFVLADGVLKLSDVDDMGIAEPFCQTDADCSHHLLANISNRAAAPCVDGQCRGHNERLNVWRAGQHFVKQLLPLRAPSSLEPQIQLLLEAYSDTSWSSQKILTATEMLLQTYSADHSSRSETRHYRHFPDSGLGTQFDYWCQQSESPIACRLTVDSQREAVSLCNLDLQCRAVVVEPFQSLKDKIQVTLKNGFSTPSSAPGSLLLLKPS
ncbi:hypothetical protein J6590_040044 [Homalodisca vitripennis]|nr:hypothetical protein J6590_040044 [Homalodisca vitripennis]